MQFAMANVPNSSIRDLTAEEMLLISGGDGPGDGIIAAGELMFGVGGAGLAIGAGTANPVVAGGGGVLMILGGLTVFAGVIVNGTSNTAA